MSAGKHTPGPWLAGEDGFNLGNGVIYARHANGNPKDISTVRGWGTEQQANARLIAAAPDLLQAITALIPDLECAMSSHSGCEFVTEEFIDQARAAIAKATGSAK